MATRTIRRIRRPVQQDIFQQTGIDKASVVERIRTMLRVRRGETKDQLTAMYKRLNPGCDPRVVDAAISVAIEEEYAVQMMEVYRFLRKVQDEARTVKAARAKLSEAFADDLKPAEIDIILELLARKLP